MSSTSSERGSGLLGVGVGTALGAIVLGPWGVPIGAAAGAFFSKSASSSNKSLPKMSSSKKSLPKNSSSKKSSLSNPFDNSVGDAFATSFESVKKPCSKPGGRSLRRVDFGNLSSEVRPLDDEITWKAVIIKKLLEYKDHSGQHPYAQEPREKLELYATILGDPTAFYNHFFKGAATVTEELREDYKEVAAMMERATREPMSATDVETLVERQVSAMNTVASGKGSMEVAMSFTEIGGNSLLHMVGKLTNRYGCVHASAVLNKTLVVEWGTGPAGPNLVSPRLATLDDLKMSVLAHRRESSFLGTMVEFVVSPMETLQFLFTRFLAFVGSFFRLGEANSRDLKAIAELATKWNRNYHYSVVYHNCQHFMGEILEAVRPLGKTPIRFGPVLRSYLDSIARGEAVLAVPHHNGEGYCTDIFGHLLDIDQFVLNEGHRILNMEQQYLLGMFHTVLVHRYLKDMEENEQKCQEINFESKFGWEGFKRNAAQALTAALEQV